MKATRSFTTPRLKVPMLVPGWHLLLLGWHTGETQLSSQSNCALAKTPLYKHKQTNIHQAGKPTTRAGLHSPASSGNIYARPKPLTDITCCYLNPTSTQSKSTAHARRMSTLLLLMPPGLRVRAAERHCHLLGTTTSWWHVW